MDNPTGSRLQDLLNPDFLQRLVQPQAPLQASLPQTGTYGVPVVYTDPPVTLRGRLELDFEFKAADLEGRSAEQIQSLAYAAVMGQTGPGIPVAKAGYLSVWQEIEYAPAKEEASITEDQRRAIVGEFLAELGRSRSLRDTIDERGIPPVSPGGYVRDAGDPVRGDAIVVPAAEPQPPDSAQLRDIGVGPLSVATDGQPDDINEPWSGPKPADQSRPRRTRRPATDEPEEPKTELDSKVVLDFIEALSD